MTVAIDISDEPGFPGLPEQTSIVDDMDLVLQFGDVSVRMTWNQFTSWLEMVNKWMNSVPEKETKG